MTTRNETAPVAGGLQSERPAASLANPDEPSDLELAIHQEEARAHSAAKSLRRARHLVRSAATNPDVLEELRRHLWTARRMLIRSVGNTEKLLAELGDRAAQQSIAVRGSQG